MSQVFTIYSVFFIATSLVSFFVAFLALQRKSVKGSVELAWLMIAAGIGAFWLIFEAAAPVLAEKIFWSKLEYFGGVATPVLYLIFILRYTGKDKFLSAGNIIILFIIPFITVVLALTNENHNLIWSGFSGISTQTNLMEYYHGIWFWIGYIGYSYVLLLLSSIILITFIIKQSGNFRSQGWIILSGGIFPWVVSVIYLTGNSPVSGLDLTPISITMSGVMAAYAILYFRFLDLVPVARETLVEILPDGILALDSMNRIQDINEAAISFLGITQKKNIGQGLLSSGASSGKLLNAVIESEPVSQIEVLYGDVTKTFRIVKKPIKNQPGSRLVIMHEITDMKKVEQELIRAKDHAEESDRLKSAFLANMSHEIRTPMNGILGFTELLKMTDLTGEEREAYLGIIKKSGNRMLTIINDIIDISKIESGQMKVFFSATNVNEQIGSIFSFFKPEAEAKGLHLSIINTLSAHEAVLITDMEKLDAILTNLVKNAIKFTHSGNVEIGYIKKGSFLEFSVRDTGIGISDEHRKFIFERFRQGSETLTRNYEGTGLGLSISKAYVLMLNGRIWFESEYGKGTVFYFTIPCSVNGSSDPVKTGAANMISESPGLNSLVVLIAEDDDNSQLLLTKIISPFSSNILNVRNGKDAVEACRNNPDIDLVLMDIKMPGMNGYEAIQGIRSFNKDIVIIAQTAFGLLGDKEKIIKAGCNDYISKPIDSQLLIGLIKKYFSNTIIQ
jgi:signal transduction histidine kinase/CheY-like chemotaxis protein